MKIVLRHMWDRAKLFLRRAGTVILGINILLVGSWPDIRGTNAGRGGAAGQAAQTDAR